ncbi:DUF1896 domain-containing protein [Chryseobacterium lactis]|uniref:DUF1896 domain-containing protein n=3 Tax=Chryseobacterium TaxID=59732 RepID=A0A3G6RNW8_CHRLC|nr:MULTISPECIES: DUF1896 family protein [Bacteroidota]AZA84521.1 DUF1896 family protein [Chryseobacterium lactis]AZB04909.1 DUF1896 family protein [Chryseobacterium lactis]KMQ64390.1 hypothetical protein ACM46_08890 [Chryseobacterium angstadtii]MBF6643676.1 DUF1896 family protein [Chryseobacterium indologenes]PNW14640.1 DUF1896 domain-containing protein [Chryseobacterium lactis]
MDILLKNLSYFRSNLQELLYTNYPEKAYDSKFISQRSNWAFKAYEGAIQGKNTEEEAERIANSILFEALYFSKFNTIFQVVTYEFDTFFVDEEIRPFSLKMLNVCDDIFKKYDLTDDFAYSTDYDYLYNDIKAIISEWIKKNLNL